MWLFCLVSLLLFTALDAGAGELDDLQRIVRDPATDVVDRQNALRELRDAFIDSGQLSAALETTALQIAELEKTTETDRELCLAYSVRGNTYARIGDWQRAIADAESALKIARANGSGVLIREMSTGLGIHLVGAGLTERAISVLEETLDLERGQMEPPKGKIAGLLSALAFAELDRGDRDATATYVEEALTLLEGSDAWGVGDTLTAADLGGLLNALGHTTRARTVLEEAVRAFERLDTQRVERWIAIANLGLVLEYLGDSEAAYGMLAAVFPKFEEHMPQSVVPIRNNMALSLARLGRRAEAVALHEENLKWMAASLPDDHILHANVRLSLGEELMALRRYGEAAEHLIRAIEIYRANGADGSLEFGSMHSKLARAQASLGDREGTIESARIALEVAEVGRPDDPMRSYLELGVAEALNLVGDSAAARELVVPATNALLHLAIRSLDTMSEREAVAFVEDATVALSVRLSILDRPEDAAENLMYLMRWKGLATRSLESRRAALYLSPQMETLREEMRSVGSEIAELTLASAGQSAGRQERLSSLTAAKERLQRQMSAGGVAIAEPMLGDLCDALQDRALVQLVRYSKVEGNFYAAFVMLPGCDVRRIELGEYGELEAAIGGWRESMLSVEMSEWRLGRRIERMRALVWDPIAEVVGDVDAIAIVPDGAFVGVPWGAIAAGDSYLVERYEFSYLQHAYDLVVHPPSGEAHGALAVGDVAYGEPNAAPDACGLDAFSYLPGTAVELDRVEKLLSKRRTGRPVQRLAGRDASELRVAEAAEGKRVLHLATHGFLSSGNCRASLTPNPDAVVDPIAFNPLSLSGVVLGDVNLGGSAGSDGLWTAEEVASLDLRGTELVVLSACDTGLGEVRVGEGVFGLSRSFRAAGASHVVMSLWPIPDAETVELMASFYKGWLKHGDASRALADAQRARIEAGDSVGAWGPFVATGAPSPK